MEWKDETTYSRSDKNRIPRVLQLAVGTLGIVIHKIVHCEGWYLTVYGLNIDSYCLDVKTVEEAKNKGLEVAMAKIEDLEEVKNILANNLIKSQPKQIVE